jgi:lactoylglutathione lyase
MNQNMHIHHIAIWAKNLDILKDFYCRYFNGIAGEPYHNLGNDFKSYFVTFEHGSKLELMQQPGKMDIHLDKGLEAFGLTHFAISVGSKQGVDDLTEKLREDGFTIAGEPRVTGDGFYESVILDPEGNRVEITE